MTYPLFVAMYHPGLGNAVARVPQQAVDEYTAKGWLLAVPGEQPSGNWLTVEAGDERYLRVDLADGTVSGLLADQSSATRLELNADFASAEALADLTEVVGGISTGGGSYTPIFGTNVNASNLPDGTHISEIPG